MDFVRFPRTPHLAWLAEGAPRDDKLMSPAEVRAFLAHDVLVEEKVDGANLGLSVDETGELLAQNRGSFLHRDTAHPQFRPLFRWMDARQDALLDALFPDLMLFGEWCYAQHSVRYTRLPDWFLAFDVYDRSRRAFWSTARRDALARQLGIAIVPRVAQGRFDLRGVEGFLGASQLTDGPAEGIYLRREEGDWLVDRAKLVRPEFVQAIGEHWSRRALEANALGNLEGMSDRDPRAQ